VTAPTYIIGIDLGTTNSVAAYALANPDEAQNPIRIFEIPQIVALGAVEDRSMLPSFILVPGGADIPNGAMSLPWDSDNHTAIGTYAQKRGAELPGQLISSAKSWLCHTLVDRNKPILPWEGTDEAVKLSPVQASAKILGHIRDAWNFKMAQGDDSLRMELQDVYVTVPASFDAVARELTVQAAQMAGLNRMTLLEEPQAAFYAWLDASADTWRDRVSAGDRILVCDVGGGTTDFSLIRVVDDEGDLALERVAVGDHLLVGGDNMDLSLAYRVSQKFKDKGIRLDAWQMRGLWHGCRQVKEDLLNDDTRQKRQLTILGRGSRLIGGTLSADIETSDVTEMILDGFFPICDLQDRPQVRATTGIREMGLSYSADPAVSKHLAEFLTRSANAKMDFALPEFVLFNGGVMKAAAIRQRVLALFQKWGEGTQRSGGIQEIDNAEYDLAVAKGAVYYGLSRLGNGIRIRSGLSKSYYLGIAAAMPAVPGMPAPMKALCVAPFGLEEGETDTLEGEEFALVVGEKVSFDFLGSSIRTDDTMGMMVEDWEPDIEKITTIETTLDGELGSVIPVSIEVRVTEVGTLELWCVAKEGKHRWKLEFNVREMKE
jgi:molecular chaperone DnaK (HSP70)